MHQPVELEKTLATNLGWTNLTVQGDVLLGTPPERSHASPTISASVTVPAWTRENGATFRLMAEHGCFPFMSLSDGTGFTVTVGGVGRPFLLTVETADGEAALRTAIVSAVIRKLELLNSTTRKIRA